jgi:hypothetical protein
MTYGLALLVPRAKPGAYCGPTPGDDRPLVGTFRAE